MKVYVVYMWAPYEESWGHKYFLDENKAVSYLKMQVEKSSVCWDIDEIETED